MSGIFSKHFTADRTFGKSDSNLDRESRNPQTSTREVLTGRRTGGNPVFSEEEQKAESVQKSTKIKPLSKQIAGEQILASHFLYGKKKELQSYLKRHYRPYPEKGDKK